MVREDIDDFVAMLHRTFPGIVFFSGEQNKMGEFAVYSDPYACMKAHEGRMHALDLTFRWPYKKEIKDGRPEVLSGGKRCPGGREFDSLQWAGRWGELSWLDAPRFAQAFVPVNTYDELDKQRHWIQPRPQLNDHFDTEDTRYLPTQMDEHAVPRVYARGEILPPKLAFILDIGDPEKVEFAKAVRRLWDSLIVKTTVRRHLITDEIVRVENSSFCGVSRRIADACALDENLYISFYAGRDDYPCFGERPTDAYIAKARKRIGKTVRPGNPATISLP
jgi:hypothetical protein